MSQNRKYELTDNVSDGVGFDIRGKAYFLRYPLTHEVEELQALTEELKTVQNPDEKQTPEQKEQASKLEAFIYGLIDSVDHDTPIKEALKNENIKVMRNFNTMVKTELSLED